MFFNSEPYRFYVTESGDAGSWNVECSEDGIVSWEYEPDDPAFLFTGLKRGSVRVTLYHALDGARKGAADNTYVIDLQVGFGKGVTESEPRYGSYAYNAGQRVTGAERKIVLSADGIVHWYHSTPNVKTDGDGMTDYEDVYTFTGRAPGWTRVSLVDEFPWSPGAGGETLRFYLVVDDEYRVRRVDPLDFERVELAVSGTTAESRHWEATRAADGKMHLRAYEEDGGGVREVSFDETAGDCTGLGLLLARYDAKSWDGFSASAPDVLDGEGFRLDIELSDGMRIHASGTNAYPDGFAAFRHAFTHMFE